MQFALLALIILSSVFILTGCNQNDVPANNTITLYNQTLNNELDNITKKPVRKFEEFMFNYTIRPEAKYEIAKDDVFTLSNGSFKSSEISVLGVMLGDNRTKVEEMLGLANRMFIAADKSYMNMEYGRQIGILNKTNALVIHLENDSVKQINLRLPFKKYTTGNTTFGIGKEYVYYQLGLPDYHEFIGNYRVYHYVTKGMELYTNKDSVDVISFLTPREFKGVKYETVQQVLSSGVVVNTTKPVLIE
jgi:hypothetical protein